MSGGVGFSRDASASFEYNRNLTKREEAFGRMKKNLYHGKEDLRLIYPEISAAANDAFRQKIIKERKRETIIQLVTFCIISLIILLTLYWAFA